MIKNISKDILIRIYEAMLAIRKFEEKTAELILDGEIKTPCHLYIGQEATAAGVCLALKKDDFAFSTHRSHGHYLAKGGDMKKLMAELYGKAAGCSRGKGGSMHLSAPEVGFLGSSAIVAGSIPLAAGTALASTLQNNERVTVCFFGDGAVNEGVFYESLNFASLNKLPVIFVCENNLYSTHLPISKCLADVNIAKKAEIFNMNGFQIDGNNAIEVFQIAEKSIEDARQGRGPALIECLTYRWRGHVGPSDDLNKGLRSREELNSWTEKCPIKRLERQLIKEEILSEEEKNKISQNIERKIDEAVKFAKENPFPNEIELTKNVFKD